MNQRFAIAAVAGLWLLAALLTTGCNEQPTPQPAEPADLSTADAPTTAPGETDETSTQPATQPDDDNAPPLAKEATLTLDQLPALDPPATKTYDRELPDNAKETLAEARQLRQKGDIPGAIAKIQRVVGYDPNNPDVHYLLGLTYMQLPDYGKAENHLAKAADYLGNDVELQFTLGRLALQQKDIKKAVRHFRLARAASNAEPTRPETAMATLLLGQLLERQGYFTAALQCYEQLGQWLTEHGDAYRNDDALRDLLLNPEKLLVLRGRLLILLREKPQAADLLQRAWRQNRSDTRTAQYLLGLWIDLDRFDDARELLVELSTAEGVQAALPILAERLCRKAGQPQLPADIWQQIRVKSGTDIPPADIGLRLADVAADLGSPESAQKILQAILAEIPSNADAARRLAAMHARQGKHTQALTLLAETLTRNADAVAAVHTGVAEILRYTPPETLLDDFSKQTYAADGENKYALHYVAGVLAQQLDKPLKAADHYRRASQERKDFLPVYEALLDLYLASKNTEDVDILLGMVKDVAEDSHLYNYLLGRTELTRGHIDPAVAALEKAYQQNPSHLQTLLALADAYDAQAQAAGKTSNWRRVSALRDKASQMLQEAIELRPEDISVYRRLFDMYLQRGDIREAEDIAEKLFRTQPREMESLSMLAEAYMRSGKHDKARIILQRLEQSYGDRAAVRVLLIEGEIARDAASIPSQIFVNAGRQGYAAVQQYREILPAAVHDRIVTQLQQLIREDADNLHARRLLARRYGHRIPGEHTAAAEQWMAIYERTADPADARRAAVHYVQAENAEQAEQILQKLIDKDISDVTSRHLLATALIEQAKYDQALKQLEQLLANDGPNVSVISTIIGVYEKANRPAEGAEWLGEQIPASPEALRDALRSSQAILYCQAGQPDKALPLAKSNNRSVWGVAQCVDAFISDENWQQAARFADAMLEMARNLPDNVTDDMRNASLVTAIQMRLQVAAKAEDFDTAAKLAASFTELAEGESDPYLLLGYSLAREKHFDRAEKVLTDRLAELKKLDEPTLAQQEAMDKLQRAIGEVLIWQGKAADALQWLDKVLANNPNNAALHNVRATALGELGKPGEAIAALQRALELHGNDPTFKNNLAYSYAEAGLKLERAEQLAIDSLKETGLIISTTDTLAWVYYKQAKFAEAAALLLSQLPALNELDQQDPDQPRFDHPIIWDHLGDTLYRLGWKNHAVRVWQVALDRAKDEDDSKDLRLVLENTPKKIQAVTKNNAAPVAPLSEAHQAEIRNVTESDTDDTEPNETEQ